MDNSGSELSGIAVEFDLRPDPRVLPMLGEINLEQWRCLGELIDNAIDGFLNETRRGVTVDDPEVFVDLPTTDNDGAMVKIRDNGPGMTPEILQNAVSAGWSGNNPIDNLGLFGMGFNIATARLGSVTEVWTTREGDAEWHGLEIDFEKLRQQKHFRTAHIRRPKPDPDQHGTEVTVKRLKPQQRTWLARSANQTQLRKRLSQTYAAMLRDNGTPLSYKLFVNNRRVVARNHCVWGEDRSVSLPDLGEVPAVIHFDHSLSDRNYCTNCMNWLAAGTDLEMSCPVCESERTVTSRRRRIKGWIGIQRHLDKTDFGFDLIRNGRKIELNSKELFIWKNEDGDEPEYPIDDQRGRGRFVGEIHLDHCRVSYAKDRFDRTDPSWEEMLTLIRGEGPLRPEKAKNLGFQGNTSPLFRLFRAFRRTSPQSKVAGAWKRIIIVKDNERAVDMARQFHEGHPDYQDDAKWWELVEEADGELLHGSGKGKSKDADGHSDDAGTRDVVDDLLDDLDDGTEEKEPGSTRVREDHKTISRIEIPSLTRKYVHNASGLSWTVEAFSVEPRDPDLGVLSPWSLLMADTATRTYHFLVDKENEAFRSMTLTPRDALLMELAWKTADYLRETPQPPTLSSILSEFRQAYGEEENLDPRQMQPDAVEVLETIARSMVSNIPEADRPSLFNDLSVDEQHAIMRNLASRRIKPNAVISDGSFLEYAPYEYIAQFVDMYPQYCFDGKIWDEPYQSLDYGSPEITNDARATTRQRLQSLITDVGWLASREASDLAAVPRDELIRTLMSLRLLRPDKEID